jgi:predicted phosphodiesterase
MKIAIASDVHLEFGELDIKNTEAADVLVLAGDICTAKDFRTRDSSNKYSARYHNFFDQVSAEFPQVLYVLGNHEHYGNDWNYTLQNIRDRLSDRVNIKLMECESVEIRGVTFLGTTLWTSLSNRDPHVMWQIPNRMSDFTTIKHGVRRDMIHNDPPRITPELWCQKHEHCREFLETSLVLGDSTPTVVITHFTPSYRSCHPKYSDQVIMNAAFHTELHDFIYDRPQVKLWIHGHTHDDFDYVINQTRVVCNPRGYVKYEDRVNTWALKYYEV